MVQIRETPQLGIESEPSEINSVAIVGFGRIGKFLHRELARTSGLHTYVITHNTSLGNHNLSKAHGDATFGNIQEVMASNPRVVVLATPNPTDDILTNLAANIQAPTTIVLSQSGVDVVPTALDAFHGKDVKIVRASIFTPVSRQENRDISYDPKKRRVALAAVYDSRDKALEIEKLFGDIGFETAVIGDQGHVEGYQAMEWTKLLTDCFNITGVVTGLSVYDAYRDPELFAVEWQALKSKFRALERAGIPIADIPWIKKELIRLKLIVDYLPDRVVPRIPESIRMILAGMISEVHENLFTEKLKEGKATEISYCLRPFIDLALQTGSLPGVDQAVLDVVNKIEDVQKYNPNFYKRLPDEQRRQILKNRLISIGVLN